MKMNFGEQLKYMQMSVLSKLLMILKKKVRINKELSFQLPIDWSLINKRNGNWELRNLPR